MRWLRFYVRSRRVPVAIAVALAAAVLTWAGWSAFTDAPEINRGLAIFTVLAVLAPMISTLGGDDDSLESGAALRWPPRRALHLIAIALVAAVPLLASRATGASFGSADEVLRAVAGLTGLIGLGVALLGTRMAWQLPLSWAVIQLIIGGASSPGWRESLFWLVEPASSSVAATTAIVLLTAGVLTYAWRVGPRRAPAEATLGQ